MSLWSSPKVASAGQLTNLHLHNNKGMTVQVLVERSIIVTFSGTPEVNGFPDTGGRVEQLGDILYVKSQSWSKDRHLFWVNKGNSGFQKLKIIIIPNDCLNLILRDFQDMVMTIEQISCGYFDNRINTNNIQSYYYSTLPPDKYCHLQSPPPLEP